MPHALPGGKLLLYLRRRDQRAQAVLAHHPGAAALRAAGTADPCRLYVRGLCAVPPDARDGRGVFFIDWISPTAQKQEDKTLLHRNKRGIALCFLTLFLFLSGCGSLKDDTLLIINAVITAVDTGKQTITVKDDVDENTLGEGCLVDCSSIPMFYCDFATQKVTRISFEELQVNDKVIVCIRSSEMERFRSGSGGENTIKVEQLQLYTQRADG